MRIVEAAASTATLTYTSVVRSSPTLSNACTALLLAYVAAEDAPIASLSLGCMPDQELHSRGAYVSSLQLPPTGSGMRQRSGIALLQYATRHIDTVRSGGSLLAEPSSKDAADELIKLMGFTDADGTSTALTDDAEPGGSNQSHGLLAFILRHDPWEQVRADASHTAIHVSDICTAIDFWSLLHFVPTRSFSTSGARAVWLTSSWTTMTLELIEVPAHMLSCSSPALETPLGLAHICLDVSALGISCSTTLSVLQARSKKRFGRTIHVLSAPRQQMMGDLIVEVAVVRSPDGVQLELLHQCGIIDKPMKPDWSC